MSKFVALLSGKNKNLFSEALLGEHVAHLQQLDDSGKLHLCGPFKDDDSAIQILIADTLEEANLLIQQDPFVQHGYYKTVAVKELIEANSGNNWLTNHPQTEEKRR
ncbi:YciI family protein [Marinomonas spartinae]|uniref:YciI family protein n=1 Tax=Marinomonas spartinae TaxID=1792290 RepID=UPI0018F24A34|nr:YciI family protein [Marinomonas spartinae]MBJ7554491.1 hypothetical protein [Marinomonas spartinae]